MTYGVFPYEQISGISSTHAYVEVHYPTVVARNTPFNRPRGSFIRVPTRNLINVRVATEKLSTRDRVYHQRTPGAKSLTAPVSFVRFLPLENENISRLKRPLEHAHL